MTGGAGVSAKGGRGGGVPLREFAGVCHGPNPRLGWIRSRSLLLFLFFLFLFHISIYFISFAKQLQMSPNKILKFSKIQGIISRQ
jgi:hypothetical protein